MASQKILFYDADTRAGATAVMDDGADLKELHEYAAGTFGQWTHIAA
jgi:hypothetical protein